MNSFYYRQPNKILRSVYLFIMFIWLIVAETTVYKCSALGACIGPDERHSDSGTTGRGAPRHQEMSRKRRTRQLHQSLRNGQNRRWFHDDMIWCDVMLYDKKVAHTRLPSIGFRGWSRFFAVSLQVTWVINPAVGCHYFPPGMQLPPPPLRGLLPILLLGEQRHNGCEQFA